jgi:sugar phosphate isomerase/epimerase
MKLGAYTACLHDQPLPTALQTLASLGLDSAEINSGGFLPPVHLPVDDLRASQDAREEYLGLFSAAGLTLTALNCNGNPLDPNPAVGPLHAQDVRDSIELAALLGVKRVVTMSGLPGSDRGGRYPSWTVEPWHSVFLDARDYQWNEVGIPFWKDIQARAQAADVKVCIEMHPHNLVYNPATMERLATEIDATHVGAEMDPSHLFWQGIDVIEAATAIGRERALVHVHAKDTGMIEANVRRNGVLDAKPYERVLERAWTFRTVGYGHGEELWRRLLSTLSAVGYDGAVSIEHEDPLMSADEGLEKAVRLLQRELPGAPR